MKVFLICMGVFGGLILLVLLLLCVKLGFYAELLYTKAEGFKFKGKLTWGFFVKEVANTEKKKEKKSPAIGKSPSEKSDTDVVELIKNGAMAVKELIWVPSKVLSFDKQCIWCKVALSDPMKNGIAYGAVSSALLGATQVLVCRFKTREYKVRVTPDFVAKDGISIKDITHVTFRPLFLIICLIYAYTKSPTLRKAVGGILKSIKKDKKERSDEQ